MRHHAHPFDRRVRNDSETHGVGRNPDAIGGYNGIGWYETFSDSRTGELFQVHCSDGVYGGKSSHSDEDLAWMEFYRRDIIKRTTGAADEPGHTRILLSSNEWAVMLNFTFDTWLDALPGEKHKTVGDANRHLTCGQIGTIKGVPLIVDPNLQNSLPAPPSDQQKELAIILGRIDHEEDIAESIGF